MTDTDDLVRMLCDPALVAMGSRLGREAADTIKSLRRENERLKAVVAGRHRALEGTVHGDFDELCARVTAREYFALDLEFLVGFSQGAFDRLETLEVERERLRIENTWLRGGAKYTGHDHEEE